MKTVKFGIFKKLFLCLAILLLLGNSIVGFLVYQRSEKSLFEQIQGNAKNIAQCAAMNVSGAVLQEIQAGDEETEKYAGIVEELALFRDNAEIEYIYTLRQIADGQFEFVVDADPEEPAAIGDICESTEAMLVTVQQQITAADSEPFVDEWGSHVSAYSPVMEQGQMVGLVGVDISANWIDEQMVMLRNLTIATCVITYMFSVAALCLLVIPFNRGIKKLSLKVKELASGSGDLTKKIDVYSKDELGEIAYNMNIFIHQIRTLVKEVVQSTEAILTAGEELSTTIRDNNRIMSGMNVEIDDISANMEKSVSVSRVMSEGLEESAGHIKMLAVNVEEIRKMVQMAKENAQKSAVAAKKDRERAMNSINELQIRMKKSSVEAEQIMRVKQIAEEIGAISGQTRMLSLNAQIEAARAGTMGAGFAVVATEVGNLSDEIDRAVKEINNINSQVQDATGTLIGILEEMIRFVTEDVAKVYDSFAALGEEYGATTGTIYTQMEQIEEESAKISDNIAEINVDVQGIAEMVTSISGHTQILAQSNEKISDSFEKLNSASEKNSQNSEKLSCQVKHYIY